MLLLSTDLFSGKKTYKWSIGHKKEMQLFMHAKTHLIGRSYKLSTAVHLGTVTHISGKVARGKFKVPLVLI